jgi:hypothetical protein
MVGIAPIYLGTMLFEAIVVQGAGLLESLL